MCKCWLSQAVLNCEPFAKKVAAEQSVVAQLKKEAAAIATKAGQAHSNAEKKRLLDQIEEIENKELPPAVDALNAAQAALEKCLKGPQISLG
jgi:hypothetical protein